MSRPLLPLLALSLLASLAGCRSTAPCELVEAELRARNADLRDARSELDRTGAYNEYLNRELRNLRAVMGGAPVHAGASTATPIKEITLGRQTGGHDKDGIPGDELLQVVLEPRDCDAHAVKAAGTVKVAALTVNKEGLKQPLCSWIVPPSELRRTWRSGLLSTGYFLQLPWKNWPTTDKVRVVVRFVAADGRSFEADKDVRVRVVPSVLRQPHALPAPPPVPVLDTLPPDVINVNPPDEVIIPPPESAEPPMMIPPPTLPELLPVPRKLEDEEGALEEAPPPRISTSGKDEKSVEMHLPRRREKK